MTLHHVIYESQSAPFTSERTVTDTREIGITVETVPFKDGNDSLILHLAIFHDRLKNDAAMGVHILKTAPCYRFQELRHGKHSPRIKPAGHMITANVI